MLTASKQSETNLAAVDHLAASLWAMKTHMLPGIASPMTP